MPELIPPSVSAKRVEAARAALGASFDDFAQLIGVSPSTALNFERGHLAPTPAQRALMGALAKSPAAGETVRMLHAAGPVAALANALAYVLPSA